MTIDDLYQIWRVINIVMGVFAIAGLLWELRHQRGSLFTNLDRGFLISQISFVLVLTSLALTNLKIKAELTPRAVLVSFGLIVCLYVLVQSFRQGKKVPSLS